jgi:nucleotide-binding universal stress UspA family protein
MHQAADLASSLGLPLAVLHVGRDEGATQKVLEEARRYLTTYRIEAEYLARTGYANETILDVMAEGAYDLLVIGAYGHSRIIEMVLGSTTEYVLRNSSSPVFLCR